jgi:hypothetical protein
MLDQIFEMSRKTLESSLQMQQAVFKHWTQDLPTMTPAAAVMSADWGGSMRKRWVEFVLEALNKQRESLDATYRAMIQATEKLFRISEARSSEDAMHAIEDVWKTIFDSVKSQSEAQFREFQSWTEKAMDIARKGDGQA